MKFTKVVGDVPESVIFQAENNLSKAFLEFGLKYDNKQTELGYGGDPFIFSLIYPMEHICTTSMPTAATDGKKYYWNPHFVNKQTPLGLKFICYHEAGHAVFMHPMRRGSRMPKLWNIAVDYIVNNMVMQDIKARAFDPNQMFKQHLGNFMTIQQFAQMIKDPFNPPKGLETMYPDFKKKAIDTMPESLKDKDPNEELTPEEKAWTDKNERKLSFFYADPDIVEDMRSPEKIYEFFYNLLPKCPKCGSVGKYKKPKDKNDGKDKGKDKGQQAKGKDGKDGDQDGDKGKGKSKTKGKDGQGDQGEQGDNGNQPGGNGGNCCDGDQDGQGQGQGNSQGQGQPSNQPGNQPGGGCGNSCDSCGGDDGVDIFGLGGTLDDHLDANEDPEKMAKRLAEAIETAKKMAGSVPGYFEDELGHLVAPRMTWKDVIRGQLTRSRAGNKRNDWNRFRTRPMFSGMLVPKKKSNFTKFACLLDTSGSMSNDDMAFGVSQLQSLDDQAEGTITSADTVIYWETTTKIVKCSKDELNKVKVVGRGGTSFLEFFDQYEERLGKQDFLVILTDGYLYEDFSKCTHPKVPVYWILTAHNPNFAAPFGKVFHLRDN